MAASSTTATVTPLLIHLLRAATDHASVAATHAKLLKVGTACAISSCNHIIAAYCRCGVTACARDLFDGMPERDVISWTALMSGYSSSGRPCLAVSLLRDMSHSGVPPNAFTFSTAASACARLADVRLGRKVHARAEVEGYASDAVVATALVDMYGKAGDVEGARAVFDGMAAPARNAVSWGSMLSVYAQNALGREAIQLFAEFRTKGVGRLGVGKSVHGTVLRFGHGCNGVIVVALVDMYSKCGFYEYSRKVFDRIEHPSVICYTSIIVAAAKYGLGSHSGLVDTGLHLFQSMQSKYGIHPCASHYACAVDMLGRAGRLEEAFELANEAQVEGRDALMLWSSLLSACRTHRRLDLATMAAHRVSEFNQDVAGALVVMSNAYTSAGQTENAAAVWSNMRRRGIQKDPGCSWIEIKDIPYVFYAGLVSPAGARAGEVMMLLDELEGKMREKGYKGGLGSTRVFDAHEEDGEDGKGEMVGVHSEVLALGFGLLVIPKGMTIRVMKNLRMCCDCHDAFKLISDIMEREFVVRDLNRFHHFKLGSCSCNDYW
uniref:DYW domain-containing protein n=1 Tax=Aegilops tauschii TaxID=37682 RepID=M8CE99_AEGTA